MDLMAMRTRKAWAIQLGSLPGGFFHGLASDREFAGGRAAHKNALDDGSSGRFYGASKIKLAH
jgi:hypothetical protein